MKYATFFIFLWINTLLSAQNDDLLSLLGEEETPTEYVRASFKSTRVVNAQSLENLSEGVLDFRISHRFGRLEMGPYDLFGLDNATMRIGFDYGITPRLMAGVGRSTINKTYDAFFKYKILWQHSGSSNMPISLLWYSSIALESLKWQQPERENYFTSRLFYTHQLIVGRKFSEGFSLELLPTLVHRNLVDSVHIKNDVMAYGIALRQKISKRTAINIEYFYVPSGQIYKDYKNALSIGLDIETGGHVFQLHFTNAPAMTDKGFITETADDWFKKGIHFGFNISRVFTVKERRNSKYM
ncbi:MAG: DUF5777 family beta-barrel protein [Chitinophagales bacterium]|nr:hypothetical protein [Bacteroidota bacterium]